MNSDFYLDILNAEIEDILDINMEDFGFNNLEEISYIDDLMENDFVGKSDNNQFSITFIFDNKYYNIIQDYIKQNGKENIVNEIINFIGEENA